MPEHSSGPAGTFLTGWRFAVLLLLICLLNGTPFLLARIGWLEPAAYRSDRQRFCPSGGPPAGLVSACPPVKPAPGFPDGFERLELKRLHAPSGPWGLLKTLRLLLLLGWPLAALLAMLWGRWPWPGWRPLLPALPLLASSAVAVLLALGQGPLPGVLPVVLAGLRSLAWLPLLLLAGPASQPAVLAQVARAMALLLVLQGPWMLVEAIWGLPMSFGPPVDQLAQASAGLPTRLVGSFIQPNSLGVAVVALLGFCIAYLPQRRALVPLALLALPPVLLARSATGLLGWAVLLALWASRTWRPGTALKLPVKVAGLLLFAAIALALPSLLGRADLWQSLSGRLWALNNAVGSSSLWQWLFGQGLLTSKPSDSLPTLLLLQGGLVALVAFYGLLAWAWQRDRQAQPFLLAVALGSLTLPITELFPINLLLGLCLHRILLVNRRKQPGGF